MQVLAPTQPGRTPGTLLLAASGLLFGAALVVSGAVLAYVVLATSAAGVLSVPIRPTPAQTVVGVVTWSLALVAPALLVIAGLARMHGSASRLRRPRRPATPVAQYAGHLSDELVTALRVRLPDGRLIPELVVGPFGVAVVSELPPSPAVRRREGHWEIRFEDGRWVPIENPLDRTVRDSEHVRRWLADDDRDFLVKVYAAAVTPDLELDRIATCAVLRPEQVPAWLASLPPQRGLTVQRRERIVGLVSERLGSGSEPRP